jgi:hypothetical protein
VAAVLGTPLPVNVFTDEEALSFLAERTGRTDTTMARELAHELGFLPLALAQAGAVIATQGLDYSTYLHRLRTLPVGEYLAPSEGEPYPHGVAEAVLLSQDAATAADDSGICNSVMEMVSLLSTAGVPRTLLHAAGHACLLARSAKGTIPVPPEVVDRVVGRLAEASLLTFSMDGRTINAHRLVMRVVRERLIGSGDLHASTAQASGLLRAVSDSLSPIWQYRPAAEDLVQQIVALYDHVDLYMKGSSEAAQIILDPKVLDRVAELRSSIGWLAFGPPPPAAVIVSIRKSCDQACRQSA